MLIITKRWPRTLSLQVLIFYTSLPNALSAASEVPCPDPQHNNYFVHLLVH